MEKNSVEILEELYQIEPELRKGDAEMRRIVTNMLKHQPEIRMTDRFKKSLRERIDQGILTIIAEYANKKQASIARKRNEFFRIFWYILGGGALASFVGALGFFQIFDMGHDTKNKEPQTDTAVVRNATNVENKGDTMLSFQAKTIPESTTVTGEKQEKAMEKTKEKINTPIEVSTKKQEIIESAKISAPLPMDSQAKQKRIAYSGENLSQEPVAASSMRLMSTPGPSLFVQGDQSADVMMSDTSAGGVETTTLESEKMTEVAPMAKEEVKTDTVKSLSFEEVVSRAEDKAMELIGKNDISLYTLGTPTIESVPENVGTGNTDSLEFKKTYIFPLKKIEAGKTTIEEIIISATGE